MKTTFEPMLSVRETREILGLSRTAIYRVINEGHLPVVRVSARKFGVEPAALRAFIAGRRRPMNDDGPGRTGPTVTTSAGAGGGDGES